MHIGILGTGDHENNLYSLCKISKAADYNVTICTSQPQGEKVQNHLGQEADKYQWELKRGEVDLRTYLSRVETICNNDIDLLYIQSMYAGNSELPYYIPFSPGCTCILQVHNTNRWLNTNLSVRMNFRDNLHTIFRKLFFRKIDGIVVEYPPMAQYIHTECSTKKPIYVLTPTVYENQKKPPKEPIRITVPGHVESERRDYHLVLDVFETLFGQYGDRIALHLLGKPRGEYGETIVSRCQDLEEAGHNIVYYDDWVPMAEFESTLQDSTFLFNPLRQTLEGRGVTETYSTSKGSGAYIDALRTGTPLILPEYFEVDDIIRESTITYRNHSELKEKLSAVFEDRAKLDELKQAAYENSQQYTLEKQAERFHEMMENIKNRNS